MVMLLNSNSKTDDVIVKVLLWKRMFTVVLDRNHI